jgi:hypothetical protein
MTDDNFRRIAKASNKVIARDLVEKIEELLDGKATQSTVVNSRGEVKHRIIIEYD